MGSKGAGKICGQSDLDCKVVNLSYSSGVTHVISEAFLITEGFGLRFEHSNEGFDEVQHFVLASQGKFLLFISQHSDNGSVGKAKRKKNAAKCSRNTAVGLISSTNRHRLATNGTVFQVVLGALTMTMLREALKKKMKFDSSRRSVFRKNPNFLMGDAIFPFFF